MRDLSDMEVSSISGGSESPAYSAGKAYGEYTASKQMSFMTWATGWAKQLVYTNAL